LKAKPGAAVQDIKPIALLVKEIIHLASSYISL
jgi:hypothetical protein